MTYQSMEGEVSRLNPGPLAVEGPHDGRCQDAGLDKVLQGDADPVIGYPALLKRNGVGDAYPGG
jgi:hypothetical protein